MNGSILLVDDNPVILDIMGKILNQSGLNVVCSENGLEALNNLKSKEIDLIICDVMMPKMNGFELQNSIKDDPNLNTIPFLFLTSFDEPEKVLEAKTSGADDYLLKPVDPNYLVSIVKSKLNKYLSTKNKFENDKNKFKKNLINVMSHELRTPLVAIKAGAEMLLHSDIEEKELKNEILNAIIRGGEKLESFINDFIILQKIESGITPSLTFEKYSVVNIIRCFLDQKEITLKNAGFEIKYDFKEDLELMIDPEKMLEIIKRVVANSVKFSLKTKKIEFSSRIKNNKFEIIISDRGIGLSDFKSDPKDIFIQLNREKQEQQGVGIGLSIASIYARLLGAELSILNRTSGGTKVIISFNLMK